jgi:hypothetical protein
MARGITSMVRGAMLIVTTFIEGSGHEAIRRIAETVIPVGIISEGVINDRGVPFMTSCENNVRESVPLLLGIGNHLQVRQTINDVKRKNVSFMGANVLLATNLHRAIVDSATMSFDLSTRMNSAIETMVGVLAKNDNDFSPLRHDLGRGIDKGECIEFMVVDSSNIDFS